MSEVFKIPDHQEMRKLAEMIEGEFLELLGEMGFAAELFRTPGEEPPRIEGIIERVIRLQQAGTMILLALGVADLKLRGIVDDSLLAASEGFEGGLDFGRFLDEMFREVKGGES